MVQWITKLVTRMRFEPLYGSFFFVRIPVNAVKKKFFTAKFNAILTKIHRFQRIQR